MIVGFTGKKRSGKDTCADYLVEKYGFTKVAFVEEVHNCLYMLNPMVDEHWRYKAVVDKFGYEKAKDIFPEVRALQQRMGTEVGRNLIDPDIWVTLLKAKLEPNVNYVVSGIRFENEAMLVRTLGGPVLGVYRQTGLSDEHISETPLPDDLIDHHVYNTSSLSDLYNYLDVIVRNYI